MPADRRNNMAKQKVKVERFDKANKAFMKDGSKRTRTGAYKDRNRKPAHGKAHKH